MEKWEYKVVRATVDSDDEKKLNELGEQGYELVGIGQRSTPNSGIISIYVLKRRKQ